MRGAAAGLPERPRVPPKPHPKPKPGRTFHLFGLLPAELRLQIWHLALSRPCLIVSMGPTRVCLLRARTTHVARACREAWHVLRSTHTPIPKHALDRREHSFFVDLSRAAVYLSDQTDVVEYLRFLSADRRAKIRHVALPAGRFRSGLSARVRGVAALCPALEALTVVELGSDAKRPRTAELWPVVLEEAAATRPLDERERKKYAFVQLILGQRFKERGSVPALRVWVINHHYY